jgi:hypothetical protein
MVIAPEISAGKASMTRRLMARLFSLALVVLSFAPMAVSAQVTTPEQFFGFKIGTDDKLARYDKIVEYFQKVATQSDRVRVSVIGPTTLGKPFIMVTVASADTIRNLDHYKEMERKLYFQGGAPSDAQRDEILKNGKSVVLITNNIHSTEIGSSQMVVDLVYKLATEDSPRVNKILDNDILLLVPSLNPDGQVMVTDWYNKYLGTPYEAGNTPFLWHPYVGHDDNRDEFLFSQRESKMIAQVLWHDWFPSIWLDEHQQGSDGSRIFTMPATDPINPNVDPLIYRLTTIYGQRQAADLEAEGKTGISYNSTYTNFWPGAMAWTGWWHNEVGLLTEVASARIASPIYQKKTDPLKPGGASVSTSGGRSTEAPPQVGGGGGFGARALGTEEDPLPPPRDLTERMDYARPWLGGKWTLGDIVDYEMIATMGLLDAAAESRQKLVSEIYGVNKRTIEMGAAGEIGESKEKNYAAIIPVAAQHDGNESFELIDKLMIGGVDVYKADKPFTQDGRSYPAGTFVVPFNQVFGRYVKDLLERQYYPEVRRAPGAPAEAPYDVAAWSLGMQFGVATIYAKTPLPADLVLTKVDVTPKPMLAVEKTKTGWAFPYDGADSSVALNRLLKSGAQVDFAKVHGSEAMYVTTSATGEAWKKAVEGYDVSTASTTAVLDPGVVVKQPRVAMYQSWTANMDEGWTRWVLEHYEMPYTTLHNKDMRAGDLRARFDAIILPDARAKEIIDGRDSKTTPPEYRGGIGEEGWKALTDFVQQGGTIVAMGDACDLLIDRMPLPVKDIKATLPNSQHFAPGTIVNLQVDTAHPVGFGVAPATYGFYINSPFFQVDDGFSTQKLDIVARYPNTEAMASGWLRGEEYQLGKAAVVAIDMDPGKVVLFGIRPQHRAQTHATFPMLFNALYWSSEGAAK